MGRECINLEHRNRVRTFERQEIGELFTWRGRRLEAH